MILVDLEVGQCLFRRCTFAPISTRVSKHACALQSSGNKMNSIRIKDNVSDSRFSSELLKVGKEPPFLCPDSIRRLSDCGCFPGFPQ